jgi:arylsulfatase A-like enzyme
VHVFGPHDRALSKGIVDIPREYDEALRRADSAVAPFLEAVDAIARRRPLAVIVASDHGDVFGPNRRWHGDDLSEEVLRVPLMIRAPGIAPGRSGSLVSTVDIMPTILSLTQTPLPPFLAGMDIAHGQVPNPRLLVSDIWNELLGYAFTAVYDGTQKLTYDHRIRTYTLSSQAPEVAEDHSAALQERLSRYLSENEAHFSDYLTPP